MSFVISAKRLLELTQSRRLHNLLQGKFSVKVLTSPATVPYHCDLSSETMQVALDVSLAGSSYLSTIWDAGRKSFIKLLRKRLKNSEVVRWKTTVHAELALIMAMVKGEIDHVEPYIGVSKLSCIMCSHYIRAFNRLTKQKIGTKGSRGKAYPGWFWPSLPSHDGKLRPAFLGLIREQLLNDFEHYAKKADSSVGSGFPEVKTGLTDDDISELIKVRNGSGNVVRPVNDLLLAFWQQKTRRMT